MFDPDWSVPVGEIIEEYLDANRIKKNTFADLIGKTPKWMSEFITGVAPLTAETALEIEQHCPYNAEFLLKIEIRHRLYLARKNKLQEISEY